MFHVLHVCVFEHLSTIPCSKKVLDYDRKKPFAARWLPLRGNDKATRIRQLSNQFQMIDVAWSPYVSRIDIRPFED